MRAVKIILPFIFLLALASWPFFTVTHLPLQDYPNHLARLFIMMNQGDLVLSQLYRIEWHLVPNLAFDLIAPALVSLLGVTLAGKIFVLLIFALLVSGCIHLHYALYKKTSLLPLTAVLFLYNAALMQGFLNYLLGYGLMLHALALWIRLESKPRAQILVAALCALILFLTHLYAVALFGLFLFLFEMKQPKKRGLQTLIRLALPFVAPALLFLLFSPTSHAALSSLEYSSIGVKIAALGGILFYSYSVPINLFLLLALINLAPLLCPRPVRKFIWTLMALALVLYFAAPKQILSSGNADWRLIIPFAFVILAHMDLNPDKKKKTFFAFTTSIILILQGYGVHKHWTVAEKDYRDFSHAISDVTEGSALYPVLIEDARRYNPVRNEHIFSYGIIEKKLFVPSQFAQDTQQPLRFVKNAPAVPPRLASWDSINWDDALSYDTLIVANKPEKERPPAPWHLEKQVGKFSLYNQKPR